jgi:hypothetical protein
MISLIQVADWPRFNDGMGSLNSSPRHKPQRAAEWGQILCRETIDRAIDDSLRAPEPESKLESENWNVKRGARERDGHRQSGIRFIESPEFLGLYQYAYQSTGEFLRRELIKAYREIREDPSRSNYYRKIFNSFSGERDGDKIDN